MMKKSSSSGRNNPVMSDSTAYTVDQEQVLIKLPPKSLPNNNDPS